MILITLVCCKRSPLFKFVPTTAKTIPFLIKLASYTPSDTVTVNSASPLLLVCVGILLNETRLEVSLERATAIGIFGIALPSLSTAVILIRASPPRTDIVSSGLPSTVVKIRFAKSGKTTAALSNSILRTKV